MSTGWREVVLLVCDLETSGVRGPRKGQALLRLSGKRNMMS